MLDQSERLGGYLRSLLVALGRAGAVKWALAGCWLAYPTLVATSAYWKDAAGFPYYLRGDLVPRVFSPVEMQRAALAVVAVWILLPVITFILTIKFYRRTSIGIKLWPVALVLVGFLLNFGWWFYKGHWDTQGFIAGLTPCAVMAIVQLLSDKLGHAFVFGGSRAAGSDLEYDAP